MDEVSQTPEPALVTKRRKPIANSTAAEPHQDDTFGFCKDKLQVNGDIVVPVFDEEDWDMLN